MRRRDFIAAVGGAVALPFATRATRAQQPAMPVIGYLSERSFDAEAPLRVPFLKALEASGYALGRNIAIEYRFADGRNDRLSLLAAELLQRQVTLLTAFGRGQALAAKAATATVPIVFASGGDPVSDGLVTSLSRPGGNATGVSVLTGELGPKRLALLREGHSVHGDRCARSEADAAVREPGRYGRGAEECPRLGWRALSIRDPRQRGCRPKGHGLPDRERAQADTLMP